MPGPFLYAAVRYPRYADMRYMGSKTSVYLSDELHEAVKASGVPLAELVRRGLEASTPDGPEALRRTVAYLAKVAGKLAEGYRLAPPGHR
jgi:hypothetical protein